MKIPAYWRHETLGLHRMVSAGGHVERWDGSEWVENDAFLELVIDGDPRIDEVSAAEASSITGARRAS